MKRVDVKRSVRVGIVGVGNCASSLVQGLSYYRENCGEALPGLISNEIGGYRVDDIRISAAFDVNAKKVGRDVSQAIWAAPNNTLKFAEVAPLDCIVRRGPTLDGLGSSLREIVEESSERPCDVRKALISSGTDVLVIYLPVGSQQAAEHYAEAALDAGCAVVNCIPVFLASSPAWSSRFEQRGLPLIGDDVKSQVGATIVHRILTALFRDRGVRLDKTFQLNFGGNADFRNMLERDRLASKKVSKTRAVQAELGSPLHEDSIHVGPSDYVPWLTDRKLALIRLEGAGFGGAPMHMEVRLEVWDSPNSAAVVLDAVRCAKLALDRGQAGALIAPSSAFMKSPPEQLGDHEALAQLRRWQADGSSA